MKKSAAILFVLFSVFYFSQDNFQYQLSLVPVNIPNFPGIHSFAYAQDNGKWLIIGGRTDGIHARQPFAAFPASDNSTNIYVVDVATQQFWAASLATLSTTLQEQLQSTNMNFHQDGNTLYFAGGYAYSNSFNDHITFPYLTAIDVPNLINAVINNTSITPYFKQINDSFFAVTGGHLKKLNNTFYLVGGHQFDGRYNPMGHATYTQTYSNQIRKFEVDNSGSSIVLTNSSSITDPVHLRRRDYNLVPQIFPNGEEGFTIFSGVFQQNVDLPFLYPVDITSSNYTPITSFNQYLSNYHSANAGLYDAANNEMYSLFFGGISQYYYENGSLIQDNSVPFVKTISRVTRNSSGQLQEIKFPIEMPDLKGSSAEFIVNPTLPHYASKIIKLNDITQNNFMIGHIVGGIQSTTKNPFSTNSIGNTSANTTIYEVWLTKMPLSTQEILNGKNPYEVDFYTNKSNNQIVAEFNLDETSIVRYFVTDMSGKMIENGEKKFSKGNQKLKINVPENQPQILMLTLVFEDLYYVSKKLNTGI